MERWTFWTGMAALAVFNLITLTFAAFFRGYGGRKGENLATHEDVQKLLVQVQAVTQATEEIKITISDKAWSRQQHMVMRQDALLKLLEGFANAEEFLAEFIGMQMAVRQQAELRGGLRDEIVTIYRNLKAAQRALRHATYVAMVSCDSAMGERLERLYFLIASAAADAIAGKPDDATAKGLSLRMEIINLTEVVRKELGI